MLKLFKLNASLLVVLSSLALCSCATNDDVDETTGATETAEVKESANLNVAGSQKVQELTFEDKVYSTDYFNLKIPTTFKIVSYHGPKTPAAVSLQSKDLSTTVTLKADKSYKTINSLCSLASKGFLSNDAEIVNGPAITDNTCVIDAIINDSDTGIYITKSDNNVFYFLTYNGSKALAKSIEKAFTGDKAIHTLFDQIK